MSFKLPEQIVNQLLERLGQDDDFRDAFVANPRRCLADLGFAPAADDATHAGIWICLSLAGRKLASKEAIRASHAALRRQLIESEATFNPIGLGWPGSGQLPSDAEQATRIAVAELLNH